MTTTATQKALDTLVADIPTVEASENAVQVAEKWHQAKHVEAAASKIVKSAKAQRDAAADILDDLLEDGDTLTINKVGEPGNHNKVQWNVTDKPTVSYAKAIEQFLNMPTVPEDAKDMLRAFVHANTGSSRVKSFKKG